VSSRCYLLGERRVPLRTGGQENEQSAGGSNGVRDKIIQMLIHAVCQRKVERASVSVKLTLSSLSS